MSAQAESPQVATSRAREWQWGWGIVFLANIPLPLFFALFVTTSGGWLGVLGAMFAVWLIGHLLVRRAPAVRGPLLLGGGCVALSQILPVLQIAAGTLAVGPGWEHEQLAVWGAFVATLLTAAQLLAVALACGFSLWWAGLLADRLLVRLERRAGSTR